MLAGTSGAVDHIPLGDVVAFAEDMHEHIEANHADLITEIVERGTFKKSDLKERVLTAIKDFANSWSR